ncbi:pseudouridine synthase [Chytriomyces sp. MP71]|nr:pseudouridine synthase [Chytriomyces sp. MP71]
MLTFRRLFSSRPPPRVPSTGGPGRSSGRGPKSNAAAVTARRVVVEDGQHASSLEAFVAKTFALRRGLARLKILNGEVSISGSAHAKGVRGLLRPQTPVHAGDTVQVLLPASSSLASASASASTATQRKSLHSEKEDLLTAILEKGILYKDQHILVINKPRNLPVQGGSKVRLSIANLLDGLQFNNPEPPRLVHRLDKDTTGCLVLARTKESAVRMSALFADDASQLLCKKYHGIVLGVPENGESVVTTGIVQYGQAPTEKLAVIEWHDADQDAHIKKAVTGFRVLQSQKHLSWMELTPSTGRKHQLRLHCAQSLRVPILGDYKYGPGCPKQLRSAFGNIETVPIHLHLREIGIKDWYGEGKPLRVECPLPSHFERTLRVFNLKEDEGASSIQ